MSYELPPEEQKKYRTIETILMVVFGGLILVTVVAVLYSKFRPLPSVLPSAKASDAAVASPSRDKQAEEQRIPPLPPAPR
jgi:hypothetical protein